jgi:hypothetical protein
VVRIALPHQGIRCPGVEPVEEAFECRLQFAVSRVRVRRDEPVIGEELQVIAGHLQLTVEFRVRRHQLRGLQRLARDLREALGQLAGEGVLAVVHDTAFMAALIQRVVALVGDEHDTGAGRDMAVVGHVNQQILQRFLLDPAVVHGNELEDVEALRVHREELDAELVQFHELYTVASATAGRLKAARARARCSVIRW